MPYVFLIAVILLEAGGTYCMKLADGFTVLLPSIGCLGLYSLCFWSFSKALTGVPLSAAYATWGALGIVGCYRHLGNRIQRGSEPDRVIHLDGERFIGPYENDVIGF